MAYIALITADEAKLHIRGLTGAAEDANLDTMIQAASAQLARYCRVPVYDVGEDPSLANQTYTRYLDGPTEMDSRALRLGVRPVQSITSIHVDTSWSYGASELVDSGDYVLDDDAGLVWLVPTATSAWTEGKRNIKAVFVAGYGADTANIPEELKRACAMQVRHLWNLSKSQGKQSVSKGGGSISLRDEIMPQPVRALLAPFILGSYIG